MATFVTFFAVSGWALLFFFVINQLLHMELSIAYSAWKEHPPVYRIILLVVTGLTLLVISKAIALKMFIAAGVLLGLLLALFFFGIVYNRVIEQDTLNREF